MTITEDTESFEADLDVTDIILGWLKGTVPNCGLVLRADILEYVIPNDADSFWLSVEYAE